MASSGGTKKTPNQNAATEGGDMDTPTGHNAPLRFLACGSVDDGKSTLIGRLLFDAQQIYEDQMSDLEADSKKVGTTGGDIDLALLVDGLQAEREQGITIDVAYRYFATARRKFIVADTPGHEQYTRNMATGASTSDLAIILIDARKGVLSQTRRHSCIAHLLGIKHVVVAVNKMDLAGYKKSVFDDIERDYRAFADALGLTNIVCIPVCARDGDNVTAPSAHMPWYHGGSLLSYLETVDVASESVEAPLRFPVQWVNRPDLDFRGFSGTVSSGNISVGDAVVIQPSGVSTFVSRIVTYDGDVPRAQAGDAVTLVLDDEVDASRGDVITGDGVLPEIADQASAHLIWMSEEPMLPGRPYLIKCGTQWANATVSTLKHTLNINNLDEIASRELELNDVGYCDLSFSKPLVFDKYENNRDQGSFILVDKLTSATVGAGMLRFGLHRAENVKWQAIDIDKRARGGLKLQTPCCLWFTGLSGSGKSTITNILDKNLHASGRHTYVLDGDNVRHGLCRDLGFGDADRVENIRRVAEVAKLMVDAGLIVMVSFISPFTAERRLARQMFDEGEFMEIFVDTPLETCERRDVKGLYKKARAGEISNFTGISSPYEAPADPELVLKAAVGEPEDAVREVLKLMESRLVV